MRSSQNLLSNQSVYSQPVIVVKKGGDYSRETISNRREVTADSAMQETGAGCPKSVCIEKCMIF